jgi:manganese transport protein
MNDPQPRRSWISQIGPGFLVTAAFIGPGTVTTASIAGASYGYALLSAVALSACATIVLQEMSGRLGLVTGQGLGEALRGSFANPVLRWSILLLVVAAVACGNAAYQTGNVTGAALGLEELTGASGRMWSLLIGMAAFLLLLLGVYQAVERTLMVLVLAMSCCFLITAVIVGPDLGDLMRGFASLRFPKGSATTVIALVGTTIVPYNLFLHASVVSQKWSRDDLDRSLRQCRRDTLLAVGLGGCVTIAILVTSAAAFFAAGMKIDSAGTMARQLEPLLGSSARYFFAAGLFAAGMTSAVTAPLAAAYATSGALGWPIKLRSRRFSVVWMLVIVVGTLMAMLTGNSPIEAIVFAQAANGILLPVVVVFLLVVMNRSSLLGRYTNNLAANVIGVLVTLIAGGLGLVQIAKLF